MGQFLSNMLKHFNRFQRIKRKLVTYCPFWQGWSTISPCVLPLIPDLWFPYSKNDFGDIFQFRIFLFCQRNYPYRHIHGGDKLLSIIFRITAALILVVTGILLITMKNMFNLPTTSIFSKSNSRKGI